jgi:hypothetical protein
MSSEPSIRVLIGKVMEGHVHTAIALMEHVPQAEEEGWRFIAADPEDLQAYLTWLYTREIERL